MIEAMRTKWPSKRILIGKTDLHAEYWRVHVNAQIAAACIAIVGKLNFLCLRLPFGTTPAPVEYTKISEAEIDLDNNLLADTSWDATDLKSPHRHLLPREDYMPDSDPLVKVYQLTVNIKAKEVSMDVFIDKIITITIDDPCWVEREERSFIDHPHHI